ncbi:hypothetical protein T08_9526, partial [Trichinella sp. T8]
LNFGSLVPMSVHGSPHRVPVFKRVFLSSLSEEIGSKWPSGKQEEKLDDLDHVSQTSQIDISWTPPELHKKRMLCSGSRKKYRYNFISHTKQPEECLPKLTTSLGETVFGHSKDENECPSNTACPMNSVCTPEILSLQDSPVKIVGRCDLQSSCHEKKTRKASILRRIQLKRTNSAKKLFQDFASGGECGYCSEFFSAENRTNDGRKRAFECEINLHSKVEFNDCGDEKILISEWSDGFSQESIAIQTSSQTSECCSITVETMDHHSNSSSSNVTNSSPVEICHFAINTKRFNGRRRFIQGGLAEQFEKSIKRQMSNLNIWHHRRRNDNAFSKDNYVSFKKEEHENIQYELIAVDIEYGYYKCICKVARASSKILIIFNRYVFESYNLKCGTIFNLYLPYLKFFSESKTITPVILTPSLIDIFCTKMPEPELYTFDTFAYYNDCNPLLWFIMIQDMPPSTPPYCKAGNRGALWNAPVMPIVQRKLCFMGAASRDAGINITDVICAPSLKCILLADSFIEGYESKLDDKDQVLEIKIDGGFSESIDYYHQHEQLKTNVMESGFRVDKTHDTSYKYPEYCNYESFNKMDERIHETLKSIRTKYADSTNRTMAVFVNKSLESVLQFITKEPPIPLELYIARKAEAKNKRGQITKRMQ